MSGTTSLEILSDDQKFNGLNLLQWNTNMAQLLGAKGLLGYVKGSVPKPMETPAPATSKSTPEAVTPAAPTPIYSSTPSLDEWIYRDRLARGHIILNCTSITGLGIQTGGTSKDTWDSIQEEWGRSTDMRYSHAYEALTQMKFIEGNDIQGHIQLLRTRKAEVDSLSDPGMTDKAWRGIVIRSIPTTPKWLPVIPSLYALSSSADIISTLCEHRLILGAGDANKATTNSSNTALTARTTEACGNPNCKAKKRATHTTANCYLPGGGKEGQFPPNFGQRSKANSASTTTHAAAVPSTTATTIPDKVEHFALSARIPNTPGQSGILVDGVVPTIYPHKALLGRGFGRVPTFMDSGASDTMFVSRNAFVNYKTLSTRVGDSAKAEDGGLEIVGEGSVLQLYNVDGIERDITYTRALHTPTLNANLVSVSALDKAGLTTVFGQGKGVTRLADGTIVLTGKAVNGMYILEDVETAPNVPLAMVSLSQAVSLGQWHRRLTHCSTSTIQGLANRRLGDGLNSLGEKLSGKCEDCIMGRQTRGPFDRETEKDLLPLDLVSFDLWGPSRVQSIGGKLYLTIIVDAGTSYKFGAYLSDKSDSTTLAVFEIFRTKSEALTGRQIRRLRTDGAFDTSLWKEFGQVHGITHELSAPYSSSQNGLAEQAIRTTIEDVRTLLRDSGLGHSYWAEAAAFSIDTRNLIPSRRHPDSIPLEAFTGKRQNVAHLRVFGAKCWAKVPTVHGAQVTGGSKLDPRSIACRLLGYASGSGNYKVQDIDSRKVFVSQDVIFEEGLAHRTLASVGEEENIQLFDTLPLTTDNEPAITLTSDINDPNLDINDGTRRDVKKPRDVEEPTQIPVITKEPRRSTRTSQPSKTGIQSMEYQQREVTSKSEGHEWATNQKRPKAFAATDWSTTQADLDDFIACLAETKASHNIPRSYKHAMATDPERWTIPMKAEIETLKAKHTWDLVIPPAGANIMDSMWVYDIKWDGEGNRIKDKARLVGKGYTQRFGIDYNETWAAVTRLESVRMTAAVAAKYNLKLWRIDFVGAYLNSLTKEDIYMKQPKGFVEPGYEDYVAKLVHTIYGTMQGGHDWYQTLSGTYDDLGYTTSRADPCIRFKKEGENYTLTDTYTDNTFGASSSDEEAKRRKDEIGKV